MCACMHAQSLRCVQLIATSRTVALQTPLSLGFFQARILEWVAVFSSRGSSQFRDWTCISWVSCIGRRILYHWGSQEAQVLYTVFLKWNNPEKNVIKKIMCVHVQLVPTLCNPTDCDLPGSSVHGIFQARILEWVAIFYSRAIFLS